MKKYVVEVSETAENDLENIIELNPEMTEKELNKLISEKILVMKTKKLISLKPIEDRFKERIEKYMIQAKEVRIK